MKTKACLQELEVNLWRKVFVVLAINTNTEEVRVKAGYDRCQGLFGCIPSHMTTIVSGLALPPEPAEALLSRIPPYLFAPAMWNFGSNSFDAVCYSSTFLSA